jgi:hypothetical protein
MFLKLFALSTKLNEEHIYALQARLPVNQIWLQTTNPKAATL